MYSGHFAAALAIKAKEKRAPSWALLVGVCLLDFLFAIFVTFRLESWDQQGVHIGWSHSLLAAVVWAVLYGSCFLRRGLAVSAVLALSVFSHFALDWPVHAKHLQLTPWSSHLIGLNLGQRAWDRGWWLELVFILAAGVYYLRASQEDPRFGRHAYAAVALILTLHILRAVLNL